MTKEEFNKLGIGAILLYGENYVEITKFSGDDTFDGLLYLPCVYGNRPSPVQNISLTEVDFFDIPEDKFVSDVIRFTKHKIKFDGRGEYTVQLTDLSEKCVAEVDVICSDGLVKYFSRPPVAISFIGSVVRRYKNTKL